MSSYDGRRSELRARLQGLANLITGQELVQLTALVEGLSSARDGGLAEVVAILTDSGSEARARDFASKLDEVHSRVSRVIADGLSALSQPTVVATQFCERIDREEDGFYVTLGATNAGGVRDKLLDAQGHLQEMTGVLARKWESLTDEDRRIEEAERAATGQLHEVIDRALVRGVQTSLRLGRALSAISQAVPRLVDRLNELPVTIGERLHIPAPVIKLYQFARELTNAVVQEAAKHGIPAAEVTAAIPNIAPGAGDLAADYVKEFFDLQLPEVVEALQEHVHVVTETLDSGYASQLQQYRAEVARQGTLLVTFSSTRQDVDGFIRDQGVESVRSKYEQADQAISSWASSSALTDGQRSDASAIAGAMRGALAARFGVIGSAYESFVRANTGRFLGGVSSETEQQILNTDRWQVTTDGLVSLGLDTRVREWLEGVRTVNGLVRRSFDVIAEGISGLPPDIRDSIARGVNRELERALGRVADESDRTTRALGRSAELADSRKLREDLNRRALTDALRR